MFCLFSDIDPRCGGTLLVEGSGRLLEQWYAEVAPDPARKQRSIFRQFVSGHPFLRRLTGIDPTADDPGELFGPYTDDRGTLRVTEISGRAGDVFVCHSNLLHAAPVHTGTQPRFLAVRGLGPDPVPARRSPAAL